MSDDIKMEVQIVWKNREIMFAAMEILKAGLAANMRGQYYFGPDDVPDAVEYAGKGNQVGVACRILRTAKLIEHTRFHAPEIGINYGERKSKRSNANGRTVKLYTFCEGKIQQVENILRKYGAEFQPRQMEMAI